MGGFSENEARGVAQRLASQKMCSIWNFSTEQDLRFAASGDYVMDVMLFIVSGAELSEQEARFDEVTECFVKTIYLAGIIIR